jgi:16S rRNA (guanine1207-N2)-methyltransferase
MSFCPLAFIANQSSNDDLKRTTCLVNASFLEHLHFGSITENYQFYKGQARKWAYSGIDFKPGLPQQPIKADLIIVAIPKSATLSQYILSVILSSIKENSVLWLYAPNDANGKRLAKWLQEAGLPSDRFSKKHTCFVRTCFQPDMIKSDTLQAWRSNGAPKIKEMMDQEWQTQPGVFSWDRPDPGSIFLLNHLPQDLSGRGADFGCGIGFLSRSILQKSERVKGLCLFDHDYFAVQCARENLSKVGSSAKIDIEWKDIEEDIASQNLDFVVMNPPFHTEKEQNHKLGTKFIKKAAQTLNPRGQLWLVANRFLPYENMLKVYFEDWRMVVENNSYKVLTARRPKKCNL